MYDLADIPYYWTMRKEKSRFFHLMNKFLVVLCKIIQYQTKKKNSIQKKKNHVNLPNSDLMQNDNLQVLLY